MAVASRSIRVLCVDDHRLMREGVSKIVGVQPDMEVVAEASNGEQAVAQFLASRPDVTLMDLQLFRIAQEAVTNAVRHGRPTRIDISVSYDERQVALTIADDGCGFDAQAQTGKPHDNEHLGLVTMRERAEQVGGELRVESAPGAGTTVRAVAGLTNEWL